jgi:hypothetical protein
MSSTALERIIDALARRNGIPPRRVGGEWIALCPGHDDTHPSLGVRGIQGQVLICCRSQGCPADQIMAGLGMTLADLYDDPRGATYRYDDGRIVHRSPAKHFHQTGNTKGTAHLYRLTQVQQAVKAGTTVWLVEGEKDVHALEGLGAVATTAPMGARNVTKCDLSPLHGANLVIIPDQDESGRQWLSDVLGELVGHVQDVTVGRPAAGKDAADHIAAGHGLADFQRVDTPPVQQTNPPRRIILTAAADITVRPVRWCWDGRLALGTLGLLAGPEGLGKSTLAYWAAARITRGQLPGEYHGQPRAVLVCATEDSWEHTIVPRLMAADADLSRVYRVEVKAADDITLGLSLPRDIHDLDQAAQRTGAALLILDPLMSRISEALDTHRDGDVRRALEPMVAIADHTGMAIVGLIHHNKSGSSDPLQLVMASKAFTAVARSVHTVIKDPDDETEARRLFGTPKNNLGRTDLPVMSFTITGWDYDTDEGPGSTGQLVWGDNVDGTIAEALRRAGDDPENRTATTEAAEWLSDYMEVHGPRVSSADIRAAAAKVGHSYDAVKRARRKLKIPVQNEGFPRVTYWVVSPFGSPRVLDARASARASQSEQTSRGDAPTALTAPTGQTRTGKQGSMSPNIPSTPSAESVQSVQWEQSEHPPARGCSDCGLPLDQQAGLQCSVPVIHRPPDLWSST